MRRFYLPEGLHLIYMKKVRIISVITTIAVMAVIFMFSSQTREASSGISTGITKKIVDIFAEAANIPASEKPHMVELLHNFVRKAAHFTLYFSLGLSAAAMFRSFASGKSRRMTTLYTVVFCCMYAVSDEIHQHFVAGRGPQVTDVILDTFGALCGSLVFLVLLYLIRRGGHD